MRRFIFTQATKQIIDIGKIAIAHEIANAERTSNLYSAIRGHADQIANCDRTWARGFLQLALGETKTSEIDRLFANATVIDFKYDRVLQQYLYWSLQVNLGIS
jgi:hypothetical protein